MHMNDGLGWGSTGSDPSCCRQCIESGTNKPAKLFSQVNKANFHLQKDFSPVNKINSHIQQVFFSCI